MEERLGELPRGDKRIIIYDVGGRLGEMVAKKLAHDGFKNVSFVEGGMTAWQAAGYPIKQREVTDAMKADMSFE